MLVWLELVRQTGIAVAHIGERVSIDWKFLLRSISISQITSLSDEPKMGALLGQVFVKLKERRTRRGVLSGIVADIAVHREGTTWAQGSGDIDFLPSQNYAALRRNRQVFDSSADPELLIAPSFSDRQLSAHVGVDTTDAFIFDHPLDHVPGMLLAKAAMSSHMRLTNTASLQSIELSAARFTENGGSGAGLGDIS